MNLNRNETKSAIVGMIIGDGCLPRRYRNGDAYFQMTHGIKQYDYLVWKQQILNNITSSAIHKNDAKHAIDNQFHEFYHLGTKRHPMFTSLYVRFYHGEHKVLDEYLVKMITPLSLAIMYMDDGTRCRLGGRSESFFLCTQSFDYANQILLKKSLKIKFDLDWNLNRVASSLKKGNLMYRLRLANRCNQKFIDIVKPYIDLLPTMQYKLGSYANTLQTSNVDIV